MDDQRVNRAGGSLVISQMQGRAKVKVITEGEYSIPFWLIACAVIFITAICLALIFARVRRKDK
jgi:hypothetical protein